MTVWLSLLATAAVGAAATQPLTVEEQKLASEVADLGWILY